MIDLWNVVAVDGRITEPYLAPMPEGLHPQPYHIPAEGKIFAFADGYPTPEEAITALTAYLAAHIPVRVMAVPDQGE